MTVGGRLRKLIDHWDRYLVVEFPPDVSRFALEMLDFNELGPVDW